MFTENGNRIVSEHNFNIRPIICKEKKSPKEHSPLTPQSCEDIIVPMGTTVNPNLPKMFLDLLVPVQGLKSKKLHYDCSICGDKLATWNSLVTHNKSHRRPACLACGALLPSAAELSPHRAICQGDTDPIVITSSYSKEHKGTEERNPLMESLGDPFDK